MATLLYFARDIARLVVAWVRGLRDSAHRDDPDYRLAWCVIVGSVPAGIVGFLLRDVIAGSLRNLWVVAAALVLWSGVLVVAERRGRQAVHDDRGVTIKDAVIIGVVQCFALVPGVSRSGATISAGLLRGLDRVTATRLSFFLAIPTLTAAGLFELKDVDTSVVGYGQARRRHRRLVRRRAGVDRLAAALRGAAPDHRVRAVPHRPRHRDRRAARRRRAERDGLTRCTATRTPARSTSSRRSPCWRCWSSRSSPAGGRRPWCWCRWSGCCCSGSCCRWAPRWCRAACASAGRCGGCSSRRASLKSVRMVPGPGRTPMVRLRVGRTPRWTVMLHRWTDPDPLAAALLRVVQEADGLQPERREQVLAHLHNVARR
ncbi:hypothetical protein GCM10025868_00660 [Angustibacter aerolatus]|uniref:Undecaprenyl-diphosphatase n=1 Tax=Angustibacter aerolatus TaxID=1162965 RepID=A0ABQ6JDG1_9ACTN|nr:hypothetical protein GCM10025868_00660 [Angustibacter aerolatus]